MAKDKTTYSPSGIPIHRYASRNNPMEAPQDVPHLGQIQNHIEKYIGPIGNVFHERISDQVHIDLFLINPTPQKNYYTIITSGLSHRPMKAPQGAEDCQYAELVISLPPDWRLSEQDLQDESNYWPLRQLKMLARFPHMYDAWLWYGHTIPNGNPPYRFAPNTHFSGMLIGPVLLAPEEFETLKIDEEKTIHFFSLVPLYTDEMNFKLKKGSEPFFEKLSEAGINELVNIWRPNLFKKRFLFF